MKIIINSKTSLFDAIETIGNLWEDKKYLILKIQTGRDRSLEQNALAWAWYGEIAKQTYQSVNEVHSECKLNYAIPILKSEDTEFYNFYENSLGRLNYEERLAVMPYVQATSLMNVGQMQRYLDAVQHEYGKQGIILEQE